jgi:hypothetical protein
MTFARRTDGNQQIIVRGLRRVPGCSVFDASRIGAGFPDLVVGYGGKNYLIEIKNPKQAPSRRRLRAEQSQFGLSWRGQYSVAETLDDCLSILGVIRHD